MLKTVQFLFFSLISVVVIGQTQSIKPIDIDTLLLKGINQDKEIIKAVETTPLLKDNNLNGKIIKPLEITPLDGKVKMQPIEIIHLETEPINSSLINSNLSIQNKNQLGWNYSPDIRNPYNVYRPLDGLMVGSIDLILDLIQDRNIEIK